MSKLNDQLSLELLAIDIPFEREYKFHPTRRWLADFAFHEVKIIVEVQGGEFVYGGHNRGDGMAKDYEKQHGAFMEGWTVIYFTGAQVKSGYAITTIKKIYEHISGKSNQASTKRRTKRTKNKRV